ADAGMGRDDQRGGALLPGLPVADDRARHVHRRYGAGHQPAGRWPAGRGRSTHSLMLMSTPCSWPSSFTRSHSPVPSFLDLPPPPRAFSAPRLPSLSRPVALSFLPFAAASLRSLAPSPLDARHRPAYDGT